MNISEFQEWTNRLFAPNDEMDMGYKPDGYWDINAPIIEGWDY